MLVVLAKALPNPPQNIYNAPKTICPQSIPPLVEKHGVVLVIDDCLGVVFSSVCIVECLLSSLYAVDLINGQRLYQLGLILLKNIVNEITWFQVHKFMWHHWWGKVVSSQVIAVTLGLDKHHPVH